MKTLFELFRRFDARCIFGSIRRLGGMSRPKVKCYDLLSTRALQVEGDRHRNVDADSRADFYPRPPGRGRPLAIELFTHGSLFLSTPSGWRATSSRVLCSQVHFFSIHALRVEGDAISINSADQLKHFYPRPPGGGRQRQVL